MIWSSEILTALEPFDPECRGNIDAGFYDFRLADADQMTQTDRLYLIPEENLLTIRNPDGSFYVTVSAEHTFRCIQCLQDLFDSYPFTDSTLLDTFNRFGSVQALAEYTGKMLGNPFVVNDSVYNLIAGYAPPNAPEDDPMIRTIRNGYYSYEYLSDIRSHIDSDIREGGLKNLYFRQLNVSRYRRLVYKLYWQGELIGDICALESNRSFEHTDLIMFKRIGNFFASLIGQKLVTAENNIQSRERLVRDLIDSKIASEETLAFRAAKAQLPTDIKYMIASFEIKDYQPEKYRFNELRHTLNILFRESVQIYHLNNIIILSRFIPNVTLEDDLYGDLRNTFADWGLQCAISAPFYNLLDIKTHVNQAIHTLNIARLLGRTSPLLFYRDFQYLLVLTEAGYNKEQLLKLCDNRLIEMQTEDEQHDTRYFKTLKYYVESGKSTSYTAKALFVHENTVNYRISRIREKYDMPLVNPEELFNLKMSFDILELADQLK